MKKNLSSYSASEKVILTLMAFSEEQAFWGINELSTKLGFSSATVQRIIKTLKDYHFVSQDPLSRKYHIGNIFYKFINTLQTKSSLPIAAQPLMMRLLSATKETITLNVRSANERLCINCLESPHALKVTVAIGTRGPLYAGSSGKCLLAYSPKDFIEEYLEKTELVPVTQSTITSKSALRDELAVIKEQGYASSLAERNVGFGSLSAPLLNYNGTLLSCISIVIPETRHRDNDHYQFCLHSLLKVPKELY
jgi:DNA-binding IclR family transcriptional regulator